MPAELFYGPETAALKVLVVEDRIFRRRLIAEALRAGGRFELSYADNADRCVAMLAASPADVLIVEWAAAGGEGLRAVERVRTGEAGNAAKATPIIMVAAPSRAADVERARNCGVDEFVARPFAAATLLARIEEVRSRRRAFVESALYIGPCRRRRPADGQRLRLRLFDSTNADADPPDMQIRKGLARMYVERIAALMAVAPRERDGLRELCLTCSQLGALTSDLGEPLLKSAATSLSSYCQGAGAVLDREVVKAHLDAILQLAELPNRRADLRQTVTEQLTLMVAKKLRQAGQAA